MNSPNSNRSPYTGSPRREQRGHGNLISNPRNPGYQKGFSQQRHINSNSNNRSTLNILPTPETLFFKIKNANFDGPNIPVQKLSRLSTIPELLPNWDRNFRLLISSNAWENDQSVQMLLMVTEPDLHHIVHSSDNINSALQNMMAEFFPNTDFFKYEEQLSNLKSFNFLNVETYLRKMLEIRDLANFCARAHEKLLDRELTNFFLRGLITSERTKAIELIDRPLSVIAKQLDNTTFLQNKFNIPNKTFSNHNNNTRHYEKQNNNSPSSPSSSSSRTYCSYHKMNGHSNEECYSQNHNKASSSNYQSSNRGNNNRFSNNNSNTNNNKSNNYLISESPKSKVSKIELMGYIEDKKVSVNVDTGSAKSYANRNILQKAFIKSLPHSFNIRTANGDSCAVTEQADITLRLHQIPNQTFTVSCYVLNDLPVDINLGLDFLQENHVEISMRDNSLTFNGVPIEIPVSESDAHSKLPLAEEKLYERCKTDSLNNMITYINKDNNNPKDNLEIQGSEESKHLHPIIEELVERQQQSNPELGRIEGVTHQIQTSISNISITARPFPVPHKLADAMSNEINDLLQKGIIIPSNSSVASRCFLIPRKQGNPRLVIDYRELNKYTLPDNYPFPIMDNIFMRIKDARIFSTLDLNSGYYQIEMDPASRSLSSFVTADGQYEFLRMPFGLKTAPATFQRAMKAMIGMLEDVYVFLDDVLIASKDIDSHIQTLKEIFEIFSKKGVSINFSKSNFQKERITFLGQIIEKGTMRPDLKSFNYAKINKTPKTKKQVQSVIGYLNWFRPYVHKISELLAPLNEIIKHEPIVWKEKDTERVLEIVKIIEREQELTIPDFAEDFDLYTDASDIGISAILLQKNKIVRLYSKKLLPAEKNYTVVEREALAIIEGLKHFRNIIYNNKINIYTDNKNFTFDSLTRNSRAQRWKVSLSDFNYTMHHIVGKENTGADFLSRNFIINLSDQTNESPFNEKTLSIIQNNNNNELTNNYKDSTKLISSNKFHFLVDSKQRILIPKSHEEIFITNCHSFLGHPGIQKLYQTINPFFFFKGMKDMIVDTINKCVSCQRNKSGGRQIGQLASSSFSTTEPFVDVSMDIFGPFPLDDLNGFGKTSLLTITDRFSRYTLVRELPEPTGTEVTKIFSNNWIQLFGKPKTVVTDQGKQFTSVVFGALCRAQGIKQKFCTAYNPTANSLSERVNIPIAHILREAKGTEKTVGELLEKIERNLNMTRNRTLGFSPEEIVNKVSSVDPLHRSTQIDKDEMMKEMKRTSELEREKRNGKRISNEEYQAGMDVFVKRRNRVKLDEYWEGPWRIEEVRPNGNSVLIQKGNRKIWENIKNLKLFRRER